MKYVLIDQTTTDMYTDEFNDKDEAIRAGEAAFERLTKADKRRRTAFFVLDSDNPDEESENHYDGNPVREWI